MAGDTVTRAQLTEAVYQEVGLSRNESAELVESVIAEISDALERGEMVKISSFGSFAVRRKGQRIGRNPKTGQEVPISPRRGLVFRASHALNNPGNQPLAPPGATRRTSPSRERAEGCRHWRNRLWRAGQQAGSGVSHHRRGRRGPRPAGACAAFLGVEIPAAEAAEARRRAALLPARGYRAAVAHSRVLIPGRLHDPRRAEVAGRGHARRVGRGGGARPQPVPARPASGAASRGGCPAARPGPPPRRRAGGRGPRPRSSPAAPRPAPLRPPPGAAPNRRPRPALP